jgi:hypothetical protein
MTTLDDETSINYDRTSELTREMVDILRGERLPDILWALSMTIGNVLISSSCESCRRNIERNARLMFNDAVKQAMAFASEQDEDCKHTEH